MYLQNLCGSLDDEGKKEERLGFMKAFNIPAAGYSNDYPTAPEAADFKDKSPKTDKDVTEFRRCLGKTERFLFSIPSLTIYPYCLHLEKFNGKTKNYMTVLHVTFLKTTWLLILGYCQETGLPICDNNQVDLELTSPNPRARLQTRASKLCPGPSHLASNHLHNLIPQPSADLSTQVPASSHKERHILVTNPAIQQDLGHL